MTAQNTLAKHSKGCMDEHTELEQLCAPSLAAVATAATK